MSYQSQSNAWVAFKAQSAFGAAASAAGATLLRTTGGPGGRLTKATSPSNEVRPDGMRTRGRHGGKRTSGSYACEWSLGLADPVLEAVMRGTWSAADLTLDQGDFTSLTTEADGIVLASGSPIGLGLRAGEVVRLVDHATPANNGRNLRIAALSASKITTAETLVANATPDTACAIVRPGRVLINPPEPLKRWFTIEEHERDIDGSEVFEDCLWGSVQIQMQPNGQLVFAPSWTGTGAFRALTGGAAPHFTDPVRPGGAPMAVADATVRVGTTDVVDLTAFEITLDTAPGVTDVIASKLSPDVFPGQLAVTMSLTALRKDLQYLLDFDAETPYALHVLAVDETAEPKGFLSLLVPNFTLGEVQKSALSREGGARTQTIQVPADLVGVDTRGGAWDHTMVKLQVSNPV
ncbi:phage tail tube protein [Rhodoplanes sp. SY1]|uniref:phage tail tube protein n=1 Tax=Rhodoplanes sp. SY1 TaxID=3166646 RepID=UPI0038B548D1